MKDSYPDWQALKKDAALAKAEDVSRDRDSALITVKENGKPIQFSYKRQGDLWVKVK